MPEKQSFRGQEAAKFQAIRASLKSTSANALRYKSMNQRHHAKNRLIIAKQTVTPEGKSVAPLIDGVKIHHPPTHQDERGTLCEVYSQSWKFDDVPMVHAYLVTVRPGKVKGWAIHHRQIDRYFFVSGTLKLVLYDARDGSMTQGLINEHFFGELNRALVSVPPGIFHAVENVGSVDGSMFNIPSEPYNYAAPDKSLLPLENDLIPYSFALSRGH